MVSGRYPPGVPDDTPVISFPTQPPKEPKTPRFLAEQTVLGACLRQAGFAGKVFAELRPSYFEDPRHRYIAAAIVRCRDYGEFVDFEAVSAQLEESGWLEQVGGQVYLDTLMARAPMGGEHRQETRLIKGRALLDALVEALRDFGCTNLDDGAALLDDASRIIKVTAAGKRNAHAAPLRTLAELQRVSAGTTWTWPGWLVNGHLTILFAPPDAGKSYLALHLAHRVLSALDWPDGTPACAPPSPALWLDYECTEIATMERAESAGMPLNQVFLSPEDSLLPLTDPETEQEISDWLLITQAGLLVIDSWREATAGLEENDSLSASSCISSLRRLARSLNIPVLLLHHARKVNVRGAWTLGMDDMRGSSALAAAARTIIGIEKLDPDSEIRRVRVIKSNFGRKPDPLYFSIGPKGVQWEQAPPEEALPAVASAAAACAGSLRPGDAARAAILSALARGPLTRGDLVQTVAAAGVAPGTADRALAALLSEGLLAKPERGLWETVPPPDEATPPAG